MIETLAQGPTLGEQLLRERRYEDYVRAQDNLRRHSGNTRNYDEQRRALDVDIARRELAIGSVQKNQAALDPTEAQVSGVLLAVDGWWHSEERAQLQHR